MTAVEYLFETLWDCPKDKLTWYKILEKAKEMEKQQIIDAYNNGDLRSADLYYDETYGSKGSDESVKNFWVDDAKYQELIRPASSQIEISDEEINEKAEDFEYTNGIYGFKQGVKWAIEQLKKKQ